MISTGLTQLRVELDGEKQENAGDSSGEALERYKDVSSQWDRINQTQHLHPFQS